MNRIHNRCRTEQKLYDQQFERKYFCWAYQFGFIVFTERRNWEKLSCSSCDLEWWIWLNVTHFQKEQTKYQHLPFWCKIRMKMKVPFSPQYLEMNYTWNQMVFNVMLELTLYFMNLVFMKNGDKKVLRIRKIINTQLKYSNMLKQFAFD